MMRLSLKALFVILLIYDNKGKFHSYFITTESNVPVEKVATLVPRIHGSPG